MNRFANIVLFVVIFSAAAGCGKDDIGYAPIDHLALLGLPNTRVLHMRTVDGISDMAMPCCDTLTIATDDQPDDFTGRFAIASLGFDAEGSVAVNPEESSLLFSYNDTVQVRNYTVSADGGLTLTYTQNGNQIAEDWVVLEH